MFEKVEKHDDQKLIHLHCSNLRTGLSEQKSRQQFVMTNTAYQTNDKILFIQYSLMTLQKNIT